MSPRQKAWRGIREIEMAGNRVAAEPVLVTSTPRDEACAAEALSALTDAVRTVAPQRDHPRPEPAWPSRTAVLGYATVSAAQPGCSNGDLQRQAREIASECKHRGLYLAEVVHDHVTPRQRPLDRPGLGYALGQIAAGNATGLVVSELSHLSHGLPDLGRVLEWLIGRDARVIAAAPGIDTGEEAGRLAIRTIIEVAQWERQRLAERTRAGMRAARRKGPARVTDDPVLRDRISGMRAAGMTLQAIANQLNAEGIPPLRGGAMWRPSSVQAAAGYQRPSIRSGVGGRGGAPRFKADETDHGA